MNIAPATIQELQEVVTWIGSENECRMWAGPAVSYPIEINTLSKEISFSPDNTFASRNESGLVAFGQLLERPNNYRHFARIIANPALRGRGFGRAVCTRLISHAVSLGIRGISLNVYRNNQSAVALYQKLGFSEQIEKSDDTNIFMLKRCE